MNSNWWRAAIALLILGVIVIFATMDPPTTGMAVGAGETTVPTGLNAVAESAQKLRVQAEQLEARASTLARETDNSPTTASEITPAARRLLGQVEQVQTHLDEWLVDGSVDSRRSRQLLTRVRVDLQQIRRTLAATDQAHARASP